MIEILQAFIKDPILFPALVALVGVAYGGTVNYPEGEVSEEETEDFDPDEF